MPDRLSPVDASFLYLEEPGVPQHVGTVLVFEGPLDVERLERHIAGRIAFVPRYRRCVRQVPGRLANPVWVDDERFDLSYHVRRSALPRPGRPDQLRDLVARIHPRLLDRTRPLWELYVVEGLADDRFAIVTKVHQAMVDGLHAIDLGQVVLDPAPETSAAPPDTWRPAAAPSVVDLVGDAVLDAVQHPSRAAELARQRVRDVQRTTARAIAGVGRLVMARPVTTSPLDVDLSQQRRFVTVDTDLDRYRGISRHLRRRAGLDGTTPTVEPTVNDAVLAVLAGALRTWLLSRGSPVTPTTRIRALVPVSVAGGPEAEAGPPSPGRRDAFGTQVERQLVDLPVGEANPVLRLHQVAYQLSPHREGGRAVAARDLVALAGFAPPTLHGLGVRVAGQVSRRFYTLLATNVPGPQQPMYAAGSRLLQTYPVIPLTQGHALAVGVTSYDGRVFVGLNADRDAVPDADELAGHVEEALVELVEATK